MSEPIEPVRIRIKNLKATIDSHRANAAALRKTAVPEEDKHLYILEAMFYDMEADEYQKDMDALLSFLETDVAAPPPSSLRTKGS